MSVLRALLPVSGTTPDFLAPPPDRPLVDIDSELARVRATDPVLAAQELRACLHRPGDPDATVALIADLLEQVWATLVAPDWPRLQALLEADISYHARRLADGGLARLFADLHPRLSYADGVLTFAPPTPP